MNIRLFSAKIGLSTATVSRAFSGKGAIDPATRDRVLAEAEKHNFHPNVLAQRLSTQSSGVVGLCYSFGDEPIFDYYNMELAQEIAKAATEAGLGLQLELASRAKGPDSKPGEQLAFLAASKAIDSLILVADGIQSAERALANMGGTPTVIISGESWEIPPCHAQIVIDFEPGIAQAVDHLVECGHRRIGYLRGAIEGGKLAAIRKALEAHRLELVDDLVNSGSRTFDDGERAFTEWRGRGVTAVICATDILALGTLRAAAASGLRVPADFSVIGIDDLAIAAHSFPTLSSVGVPRSAIAQAAIAALRNSVDRSKRPGAASSAHTPPPTLVPTYFIARESSAPTASL